MFPRNDDGSQEWAVGGWGGGGVITRKMGNC